MNLLLQTLVVSSFSISSANFSAYQTTVLNEVITFHANNSAYEDPILSFVFFVGRASCPAVFARRQQFLLRSAQDSLLGPRN